MMTRQKQRIVTRSTLSKHVHMTVNFCSKTGDQKSTEQKKKKKKKKKSQGNQLIQLYFPFLILNLLPVQHNDSHKCANVHLSWKYP